MRELPVPFTAAMVQAIRAGRKTQTRRLRMLCRPGDRLWVRESWRAPKEYDSLPPREVTRGTPIHYEADGSWPGYGKLRPPMFMPRWMCRTVLDVTEVRGHQLAKITEAEAIAEGVNQAPLLLGEDDMAVHDFMLLEANRAGTVRPHPWPVARFGVLWDSINGEKAPWSANPYVWAHSFKVAT